MNGVHGDPVDWILGGDRRVAVRYSAGPLPAEILPDGPQQPPLRLLDVSADGCALALPPRLALGDRVTLRFDSKYDQVAFVKNESPLGDENAPRRYGLEFEAPANPDLLRKLGSEFLAPLATSRRWRFQLQRSLALIDNCIKNAIASVKGGEAPSGGRTRVDDAGIA